MYIFCILDIPVKSFAQQLIDITITNAIIVGIAIIESNNLGLTQ